LSRDPIGEKGGGNLYEFALNVPTDSVDADGRVPYPPWWPWWEHRWRHAPPDPRLGFHVVGSVIEERCGGVLQAVGIDHVDIAYNGRVVYVGRGGAVGRWGNTYTVANKDYRLSVRSSGNMRYGRRASCPCKNATDSDVLDCLNNRRQVPGRNCQGDVQDAVGDCCLSGFKTLVGTLFPNLCGR
jgi:hypothetical protein